MSPCPDCGSWTDEHDMWKHDTLARIVRIETLLEAADDAEGPICKDKSPHEFPYLCTEPKGHAGTHACKFATWPNRTWDSTDDVSEELAREVPIHHRGGDPECPCWMCRALVAEGANKELREGYVENYFRGKRDGVALRFNLLKGKVDTSDLIEECGQCGRPADELIGGGWFCNECIAENESQATPKASDPPCDHLFYTGSSVCAKCNYVMTVECSTPSNETSLLPAPSQCPKYTGYEGFSVRCYLNENHMSRCRGAKDLASDNQSQDAE